MGKSYPLILNRTALIRGDLAKGVDLNKHFTKRIYKESNCAKCPNLENRHDYMCDGCPAYLEKLVMWDVKRIKGKNYVSVPLGDRELVEKLFGVDYDDARDRRAIPPMPYPLKYGGPKKHKLFTGKELFEGQKTVDQVSLVNAWAKKGLGFLAAPPRSGKTQMGTYISVRVGMRTLITASDTTWLEQFKDTYRESTNAEKVARQNGMTFDELIFRIDKPKDFDLKKIKRASVVLVNYQKFIYSPQRIKEFLHNNFGLLIVDEADLGSASAFAKFINATNTHLRLALTATTERRDNRHVVGTLMMGPVVARADETALRPEIDVYETGIDFPAGKPAPSMWHSIMKFIETHPERNKMIVRNVMRDLKRNNHSCVIIPVKSHRHMYLLEKKFKKKLGPNAVKILHGKSNKKRIIASVEKPSVRVLISIPRMIQRGVNMKRPTCVHLVFPMADGNTFYQLAKRPCTPVLGKRAPQVKMYVDDFGASRGCFASLLFKEINPHLPGRKAEGKVRYLLHKNVRAKIFEIAKPPSKQRVKNVMQGRKRKL